MAYINEPYKFVYTAKNFTPGLSDVKLVVFKPNMVKLGVYNLTEVNSGDGKGIYYYDFNDADIVGTYIFICNSISTPLKDARTLFFDERVSEPASILDEIIDGGYTVREALKIALSVFAGKSSGGGTTEIKFRNIGDTKDTISATVDFNGNRTAVTIDP